MMANIYEEVKRCKSTNVQMPTIRKKQALTEWEKIYVMGARHFYSY